MRRWWTALAVGATATALAGCGTPAGVDGDLVDDWKPLAAPTQFVPAAGACHTAFEDVGYLASYNPVDCGASHRVETIHVGTVTGPAADRSTSPAAGSAGMKAVRAECDREVNKAVGGDWRSGRLFLSTVFPSKQAWAGGARWFRCDLNEKESLDDSTAVTRTGSLKGALTGNSALAYRCFSPKIKNDRVTEMTAVSCTKRHRAEFVGVHQGPDIPFDQINKNGERIHRGCLALVAAYAKVPNNGDMKYRAGTIFYHAREAEWNDGNRGVQCFLWVDRDLTRSVKGAGTKVLPVT
ncbi:septum formation family protein [Micromonospora olivasterospora]|uniref:Putative regulator of septum formation n=1 Tax=Micromonospora olivasterospora TaxID=1880 RepID=A0A562IK56_MICOL|nr:septum formation family protein [Micromonospora olivasterospora]TWH71206.1 putative regulator of septum formation [Micromonospora olivasterospora]